MRKRRTREHIIADLSANHVERFILRSGHTVQRFGSDYGYDLFLTTFDENGAVENGIVFLQLKATDNIRQRIDEAVAFTVEMRDMESWCHEEIPVILIIYDAIHDRAFWLHIQGSYRVGDLPLEQATITVTIPRTKLVDEAAIEQFRQMKIQAFRQE